MLYTDFEAVGFMSLTTLMNPSDGNLFLISPSDLELMITFPYKKQSHGLLMLVHEHSGPWTIISYLHV